MKIPWTEWEFDPGTVIPLLLTALLYIFGARRSRGISVLQMFCFWSGWASLVLALLSPLATLDDSLFSAHMLQHEILMLVAAPLLVLSRPVAAFLWALPLQWRKTIGSWSKLSPFAMSWRILTLPLVAWWLHAAAIWIWHAPPIFDATLTSDGVHAAQHVSFLGTALLFWWSLFRAHRSMSYGSAVLYIFTTAVHTSILGALLTFAPRIWYSVYATTTSAWGLPPLEDQQIGGLIMWVPAGVVYLCAGLAMFAAWLRASDRILLRSTASISTILLLAMISSGCRAEASRNAAAITGGSADRGASAISRYGCGSCHTIQGIAGATGLVGPPLTGVGDRLYLAGVLPNKPQNMTRWIRHPREVDDKTVMPELGVTDRDALDIAAYLYSLP